MLCLSPLYPRKYSSTQGWPSPPTSNVVFQAGPAWIALGCGSLHYSAPHPAASQKKAAAPAVPPGGDHQLGGGLMQVMPARENPEVKLLHKLIRSELGGY